MKTTDKKALIYINLAVLLFGLAGLFAKWIDLPSAAITFGRVLFSSIALGLYMLIRREPFRLSSRRDLFLLIGAGVILALHWWAFIESIRISTVAIGTLTFSTFPLFVTFLEPLVTHQKIRLRNVGLALLILVGVIITIPEFSLANHMFLGILTGMLSSLAYAVLTLLNKGLSGRCSGTKIAFYEQSAAMLALLPLVLTLKVSPSAADIGLVALLGVLTTALAHTLFIQSLKKVPAQLAGIISSMETVYGIVLALLILGEVPSMREILGGIVILVSVVLAQLIA